MVRTRFAPSPTGFLHVGGARTALFSWAFARHHKGEFILRIEDTDQERSTEESVQAIFESMNWLGLNHDGEVTRQTARYSRYREVAMQLLEEGFAYKCLCTKERLSELRQTQMAAKQKPRYDGRCRDNKIIPSGQDYVIRFKNPVGGIVAFTDQVYGKICVHNDELDDLVLIRSDGNPTYNFVVVVDDWDFGITHVIRGDDHINNTPRQINLLAALKANIPVYAHLPMILGEDGKRLSKRHGAVSVMEFKEQGILPHALLNYLVRLGWSHKDQEIFSKAEIITYFNLKNISRGAASFNYTKLYWLNQHYQKSEPVEDVANALQWYFDKAGIDVTKGPKLVDLIPAQVARCKTLVQICEASKFFYVDNIEHNTEALQKYLTAEILGSLKHLYEAFNNLNEWNKDSLQECINTVCVESGLTMSHIAQPLRVAVTGNTTSPAIDITLALLGKKRTLERLKKVLK